MDKLDKLENLDISNNSFTYIPERLAKAFGRGNHLNIGLKHNPFYCDYRIRPINTFMKLAPQAGRCPSEIRQGIDAADLSMVRPECLQCVGPPDRQGKYVLQLTAAEMKPPPPEPEDPLGTGGIVAILVALIVILIIIAVVLIVLKRRQQRAKENPGPGFEDEPDWDNQADYEDSFDESRSTFSGTAKSVAHESNI